MWKLSCSDLLHKTFEMCQTFKKTDHVAQEDVTLQHFNTAKTEISKTVFLGGLLMVLAACSRRRTFHCLYVVLLRDGDVIICARGGVY